MNTFKTVMLMSLLTPHFLVVGALIGGGPGMVVAFLFAAGTKLFAYWNSDRMLLSMYGARQVDESSAPELYHIVQRLSRQAGLPMPKVFIADNPQPNAFATGRSPEHAAICVTSAILARLDNEELAGVIAHELGHVKNRDTLTLTITAVIAGAVGMLANFAFFMGGRRNPLGLVGVLLVTLLAPIAAMLVQMTVSRSREFEADRASAGIIQAGNPYGWPMLCRRSTVRRSALSIRRPMPIRRRHAYVHRQSTPWRHERIVRQPSLDRRTHRAAEGHGGSGAVAHTRSLGLR